MRTRIGDTEVVRANEAEYSQAWNLILLAYYFLELASITMSSGEEQNPSLGLQSLFLDETIVAWFALFDKFEALTSAIPHITHQRVFPAKGDVNVHSIDYFCTPRVELITSEQNKNGTAFTDFTPGNKSGDAIASWTGRLANGKEVFVQASFDGVTSQFNPQSDVEVAKIFKEVYRGVFKDFFQELLPDEINKASLSQLVDKLNSKIIQRKLEINLDGGYGCLILAVTVGDINHILRLGDGGWCVASFDQDGDLFAVVPKNKPVNDSFDRAQISGSRILKSPLVDEDTKSIMRETANNAIYHYVEQEEKYNRVFPPFVPILGKPGRLNDGLEYWRIECEGRQFYELTIYSDGFSDMADLLGIPTWMFAKIIGFGSTIGNIFSQKMVGGEIVLERKLLGFDNVSSNMPVWLIELFSACTSTSFLGYIMALNKIMISGSPNNHEARAKLDDSSAIILRGNANFQYLLDLDNMRAPNDIKVFLQEVFLQEQAITRFNLLMDKVRQVFQ
ncbi:MAG: hypothetical protein H6772_04070 [Pseudomonadales bacterium]|nr:hypothetical protein [Pseudomonadales bacterium]